METQPRNAPAQWFSLFVWTYAVTFFPLSAHAQWQDEPPPFWGATSGEVRAPEKSGADTAPGMVPTQAPPMKKPWDNEHEENENTPRARGPVKKGSQDFTSSPFHRFGFGVSSFMFREKFIADSGSQKNVNAGFAALSMSWLRFNPIKNSGYGLIVRRGTGAIEQSEKLRVTQVLFSGEALLADLELPFLLSLDLGIQHVEYSRNLQNRLELKYQRRKSAVGGVSLSLPFYPKSYRQLSVAPLVSMQSAYNGKLISTAYYFELSLRWAVFSLFESHN